MFVIEENEMSRGPVIKVVGVGGGGCNAVQHMVNKELDGVEFIVMNTDEQALASVNVKTKLTIGRAITRGLGAGANPDVGRQAALEDADRIKELLAGANMVFVAAGMGGGTGTGAAPEVAKIAREMGILTVAVVTKPFSSERRDLAAEKGLEWLMENVDSAIVIANDNLIGLGSGKSTLLNRFADADDVLFGAVEGIADIMLKPGRINTDFSDVQTVMQAKGLALMGSGRASGPERAKEATEAAITCPLLDDVDINGAQGILVNITSGPALEMGEMEEITAIVHDCAADNAEIIRGWVLVPEMDKDEGEPGDVKVTIVATGLGNGRSSSPTLPSSPTSPSSPTLVKTDADAFDLDQSNYPSLDDPAWQRRQAAAGGEPPTDFGEDFLDLPTFLRRQAD